MPRHLLIQCLCSLLFFLALTACSAMDDEAVGSALDTVFGMSDMTGADVPRGPGCLNSDCSCVDNTECFLGNTCGLNGECVAICIDSGDCVDGAQCLGGGCESDTTTLNALAPSQGAFSGAFGQANGGDFTITAATSPAVLGAGLQTDAGSRYTLFSGHVGFGDP